MTEEKKEKLFEIIEVENTPFNILSRNGKFQIILRNQIVSGTDFLNEEDARNYIESKPWELIMIASHLYSEGIELMKEEILNLTNKMKKNER